MEMMAAIESLHAIAAHNVPVHFYTDSTYLIRGITQWIWGWKKEAGKRLMVLMFPIKNCGKNISPCSKAWSRR